MTVVARHPVIEVRDGYVICGGVHRTATLKLDPDKPPPAVGETHQLLRPVFHWADIAEWKADPLNFDPKVGDVIEEAADGSLKHVPRPVGQ